jgi:hypothetical protein
MAKEVPIMEWNGKNINFKWNIESCASFTENGKYYHSVRCGSSVGNIIKTDTNSPSEFLIRMTKKLESRYIIADSDITGYKMMYQRFRVHECSMAEFYIPVLVDVKVPKGSLIYTDPHEGKRRASAGVITYIHPIKDIIFFGDIHNFPLKITECVMVADKPNRVRPINIWICINDFGEYVYKMKVLNQGGRHATGYRNVTISHINKNELFSIYEINKRALTWIFPNNAHIRSAVEDLYSCPKYQVWELIEIDNFDTQPVTCSTGFHFFETAKEAITYVCN